MSGISTPLIDILATHVSLRTADPYGEVLGGFAKVLGNLKKLPSLDSEAEDEPWPPGPGVATGTCWDTCDAQVEHEQMLVVLPILSTAKEDRSHFEFLRLLLQPTNVRPDEFRRVGLLSQQELGISKFIPGLEWDFERNDWSSNEGRKICLTEISRPSPSRPAQTPAETSPSHKAKNAGCHSETRVRTYD
jgi:hypothetical protein